MGDGGIGSGLTDGRLWKVIEFQERGISEERREKNGLHLPMSDLYHQLRSAPASVLALGAWPLPNRTLDELARGAGSIGCFQGLRWGLGGVLTELPWPLFDVMTYRW